MNSIIYTDFSEIEESIKQFAPPIVYKYRDFGNIYHIKLLTEQLLWMANPKELNDPYDIRTPIKFDVAEIEDPRFLDKLKTSFNEMFPNNYPDHEVEKICKEKLDQIRIDPDSYFRRNARVFTKENNMIL